MYHECLCSLNHAAVGYQLLVWPPGRWDFSALWWHHRSAL